MDTATLRNRLRQVVSGEFGQPRTPREADEAARAEGLNVPRPLKMLEEARSLGAKLIACETTVRLCGLTSEGVEEKLDEVMGLVSIWRLTEGARVLSF